MHQLSADILEEILSRLHVKDLLRFKSVSKTWNSIISSQYFINLHLKKSISSPSHCRIFPPYSVSLVYDDVQQVELTWPDEATGYFIGISSDGLVCYMDNISVHPTRICVWNPATRVSKTLNIDGMKFHLLVSWFGRESSDDVYKVVLGIWLREANNPQIAFNSSPYQSMIPIKIKTRDIIQPQNLI
ncbi:PREDICTED: putative F-box protein At3g52320 [Erythranthe guttata]|uniref:putative F-box protein At3g52320 n=1 Tax=Erythranthe guttata TaxID=4155 RepID=UPI00064DFF04|nr:PREDICTED: putative F-box protein At3g52320 [Erythranthe guttata]|eukprot:XP_012853101.1 PREDICTED: putative F-box protein At3g52320 [Erythranthe guttata]